MVGVPQRLAIDSLQMPMRQQLKPVRTPRPLQVEISGPRVGAAKRANPLIALKNLFPEIPRIRSKPPLVNAPRRTESRAPGRYLKRAPSAQRTPILAFLKSGSVDVTAGHRPRRAHRCI